MNLSVNNSGPLKGTIRPPSDKSITHRAIIFAAMADSGPSVIKNPLDGEDCLATLEIVKALGCEVERNGEQICLSPPIAFSQPDGELDCGNSGTTMRLMAGVLASTEGMESTLVGDPSLSRRPMRRITDPLTLMGAQIEGETAPLIIHGRKLRAISYESPVASAQIKSCVLLAGLRADGETWVTEPSKSRDHTERFLQSLGVELLQDGDLKVGVVGGSRWSAFDFSVPADISSSSFLLCAAAMIDGSNVTLEEVCTNPTRTGVLDALESAGVTVERQNEARQMGEPTADLHINGTSDLRAFTVGGDLVPRLIDEIPVLAVLASQCNGTTKFRDAKELRVKETDRIERVAEGMRSMGAEVTTYDDGLDVTGPVQLKGTQIDAAGDHRIGMAFAVAGLIAEGQTTILNADSIRTSYPQFEQHLSKLRSSRA